MNDSIKGLNKAHTRDLKEVCVKCHGDVINNHCPRCQCDVDTIEVIE